MAAMVAAAPTLPGSQHSATTHSDAATKQPAGLHCSKSRRSRAKKPFQPVNTGEKKYFFPTEGLKRRLRAISATAGATVALIYCEAFDTICLLNVFLFFVASVNKKISDDGIRHFSSSNTSVVSPT